MAAKRLDGGWTITCGIWPPFLLPALTDVKTALREQGFLRREPVGLDALHERWVETEAWVYALEFDCPDEEERWALRFEMLSGQGEVRLNGRRLARFASGTLSVDITGCALPEKNRLEVAFDPALPSGTPRGILGSVWLRATNYVELKRVRATASGGLVQVVSDLVAHTAGRFLFRYQVSIEGEMALAIEVFERLRAAEARVEHVLKLPEPVLWDGDGYYTVRLFVERSGVGCDSALVNAAMDAAEARRIALLPPGRLYDRDLARLARELGAEAACYPEAPGREDALVPLDLLSEGLLPADGAECPREEDFLAMPVKRGLERLAGGERYWPADAPVWRATGSPSPDQRAAEARYGANALGDAARYARVERFVQAEAVRQQALSARRDGRTFAIQAAEGAPVFRSAALIEYSGGKRPAYGALRQAWGACAAFDLTEVFAARAPLPVRLYSAGCARRPGTVTASVYALDGKLIASTSFATMAGEDALLGEVALALPEEGLLIARAEFSFGATLRRVDQAILLSRPGAPARGALLNPPRAELRIEGEFLCCTGAVAALGVWTGSDYGALLPGEKLPLSEGIAAADIESLNGQIL